ncbi:hypothetical protein PoB_005753700 [Plakobranchus ocellatus]|uniref:Uncharacterized protein n=1 Tax=Plakobranchus ocellatus TaxID=259542 RepID=A0AAV4CHF0_9GAST|nr:hypothetical protein PoB_005753700 [Plakobranchus ocellatus]
MGRERSRGQATCPGRLLRLAAATVEHILSSGPTRGTYDGEDGLLDNPQTNSDTIDEGSHDGLLDDPQTNSDTNDEGSHEGLLEDSQTNSDANDEGSHEGLLEDSQTNSDTNDEGSHDGLIAGVENLQNSLPFIKAVLLYDDQQIQDILRFCCPPVTCRSTVLSFDKTFNLGQVNVTLAVYKNLSVYRRTTNKHPLFCGPMFMHGESDVTTFFYVFSSPEGQMILSQGNKN